MELIPVQSSNVSAIGYHEDCRLLRVRFLDGRIYDYPGVSPDEHASIMSAPSKGAAIRALGKKGVLIGGPGEPIALREPRPPAGSGTLNTFDPDECCDRHFVKFIRQNPNAKEWACPACGTPWKPELHKLDHGEGTRHWSPHPLFEVFGAR